MASVLPENEHLPIWKFERVKMALNDFWGAGVSLATPANTVCLDVPFRGFPFQTQGKKAQAGFCLHPQVACSQKVDFYGLEFAPGEAAQQA